jgi:ABC-2 type transport system permease protein
VRKTWAVAWKELRQVGRDPLTLVMLIGVPCLMLVLYGYALNFDVRHVALAVEDRDHSAASRALVDAFIASTYFDLAAVLPVESDLELLMQRRVAQAVLVIPERFGERIAAGRQAPVQLVLDGADARTATTILGYANAITAERNLVLFDAAAALGGPGGTRVATPRFRPRVWYNPELRSSHFLVPGLIGVILMLTAVLSTALSVVREKERGTLEQLRTSPLGTFHLLLGKTLPYLFFSLFATLLILLAARALFGVEVRGPKLALFLATLLFLAGALSLGLLISSISTSQAMAFQIGSLASLLPTVLLSGFVFPISSMPRPLQWLTLAVPARHYLVILRGIILKGSGLAPFGPQLAALAIFAATVLALAAWRMSRQGR